MDGELAELLGPRAVFALECVDRVLLNGYVANLQVGGQVVNFLCAHRGNPLPSPALLERLTKDFVRRVESFAREQAIPMVHARKGERKEDLARPYQQRLERSDREGVAVIVVAREKTTSFRGTPREGFDPPRFQFYRASVMVKVYYFYVWDRWLGPAFIKVSTYFPFPVRVCVNGHEWLKRRLAAAGIGFTALDNGLAACDDPATAQALADRFTPARIAAFFSRWVNRLPWPLTPNDRAAGYRHDLSVLQFEYACTAVFDRPQVARRIMETLVHDHFDLGRPEHTAVLFGRRHHRATPRGRTTTLIDRDGVITVSIPYKRWCRIKQYVKHGRALRVETVINDPLEVGVRKRLPHLPALVAIAKAVNRRTLDAQRVAQQCIPETRLFQRVCLPSTIEGHRAPGLRFGDHLVLGLLGALTSLTTAADGLTNASLRAAVADRTGIPRTSRQTSYDLKRLRVNGLIRRIPHTNRYQVTDNGRRLATVYTRTWHRVIALAEHTTNPGHDCPHPLAHAWQRLDKQLDRLATQAGLRPP